MLGDIYMLEENYEQAIFEFNEAIRAIYRQKEEHDFTTDSSHVLFLIRVKLKLGLAYEKRKTFDTAYATYEKLVEQILNVARKARFFGKELYKTNDIIDVLHSNSSIFSNLRILYLGILAKISVLEKLDMGGIRVKDLVLLCEELKLIYNFAGEEIRPLIIIDFFTKLGDILYFNGCNDKKWILDVNIHMNYIKYDKITKKINKDCKKRRKKKNASPCCACLYYNISVAKCLEELEQQNASPKDALGKAVRFLELLDDEEEQRDILKKGNVFMMTMANALVGLGNTLYGCAGGKTHDYLVPFFDYINNRFLTPKEKRDKEIETPNVGKSGLFKRSLVYYLAAARTYELLTDHKSAYNIYVQMLDAVHAYFRVPYKKQVPAEAIKFCEEITNRAINCTYWHYDNINCAEIDTIKHELVKKHIDQIKLYYLSSYPEIEVAIYKYYSLCLLGDTFVQDKVLRKVLNSRQMGQYKLVATLTQNIQNLYFKVLVNEEILSRIIPKLYDSLLDYSHSLANSIKYIANYYLNADIDSMLNQLNWDILIDVEDVYERRFCLLDYLLKDSLYCLNRITDLIAPLYSTTLYSNAFIGEVYEKAFNWNHLLICMREIFEYTETTDKNTFYKNFYIRYYIHKKDVGNPLLACGKLLSSLDSWGKYNKQGKDRVKSLYEKVCPDNNNYMTSTYLTGNAIDFFNRSLEMHSTGKSYQEMMSTMFFLEDDLHNDSNYLNFANEMFLINHGYVNAKIKNLENYSLKECHLLDVDNYIKK
jgi:hypothetical protein